MPPPRRGDRSRDIAPAYKASGWRVARPPRPDLRQADFGQVAQTGSQHGVIAGASALPDLERAPPETFRFVEPPLEPP